MDTTMYTNDHLVKEFKLLDPPVFVGSSDIAVAEEWFLLIEKKLGLMRITDGERVTLATSMLKGEASHWWDINRHAMVIEGMTWREFVDSFLERYYPFSDRSLKKTELMQLAHLENNGEKKRLARYPSYAAEMEILESKEIGNVRMCNPLREQEQKVSQYGAPKEIEVEGYTRMKNEDQEGINLANLVHDIQPHPYSQEGLVVEDQATRHVLQNQEHQHEEEVKPQQRKKNGPSQKDRRRRRRQREWAARMGVVTVMNESQQQLPKIAVAKVVTVKKEEQQQQQPELPFVEVTTVVKVTELQDPEVTLLEVTNEMKETSSSELGLVDVTAVMTETREVAPVEIRIDEQQKQLQQVQWKQEQLHVRQPNQMQPLAYVEFNIEKQKHQQQQQLSEQQTQQLQPILEHQPAQNFKSLEIGEVKMSSPLWEPEQQAVPYGAPYEIKRENFSSRKQNGELDAINFSNPNSEPNFMQDLQHHPYCEQSFVVVGPAAQHVCQDKQLEEEEKGQQQLKQIPKARKRNRTKRSSKKQRIKRQRRQQQSESAVVEVVSEMKETQDQLPEAAVMEVTSEMKGTQKQKSVVTTAMKETQQQEPEVTLVEFTTATKETQQQEPEASLVGATSEMKETQQLPEVALVIKSIEEKQKQLQQQWEQMQQYMHQVLSPQVHQLQQRIQQQPPALVEFNLDEQNQQQLQQQQQHQQLKQWQQLKQQPQPLQPKQVQQHHLEKKSDRKQYQPEVAMVEFNIEDFWANERNRKTQKQGKHCS